MGTLKLYDFSGGLNLIGHDFYMNDNETPYCENVVFTKLGAIQKRKGYKSIGQIKDGETAIESDIKGIYSYNNTKGDEDTLVICNKKIYLKDDLENPIPIENYEGEPVNIEHDERFSFAMLGDILYMSNGYDYILQYDGDKIEVADDFVEYGVDNITIKGKYITEYYNSIIVSGDPQEPSRVYVCEIGLPYMFEEEEEFNMEIFRVSANDGDEITGLIKFQGNLAIFKENSIHILYGENPDVFQLREVNPNLGCIAPYSIVNIYNNLYFLYRDGVYTFNGSTVKVISEKIQPKIDIIKNYDKVSGAWYKHHYFLSYPESSNYNNKILSYNILHESWTYFTNIEANIWSNFDGSQESQKNIEGIFFGNHKGQIYQYDDSKTRFDDDGEDINSVYRTKYFNFQQPELVKTFRKIMVDNLSQGEINIHYDVDQGRKTGEITLGEEFNQENLWDKTTWENLVWYERKKKNFGSSLKSGTYGRNIRFVFKDKSKIKTEIFGIIVNIKPRRRRFRR